MRFSKRAWLAAFGLALGLLGAGLAWAHPSLVRSEPPAYAALPASPERVTVWFDEAIEPDYGNLAVYSADGLRVDRLDTRYQPGPEPSLTVSLPSLPEGSYVAVWRVISAGDAHAVGGAIPFGVGVTPDIALPAGLAPADTDPDAATFLVRYLGLLAQSVLAGAVIFRQLVWRPALLAVPPGSHSRVARAEQRYVQVVADILRAGLIIGLLGSLYIQARLTGVWFWELFGTRWGALWVVRAVAAFIAAGAMEALLAASTPRRTWLAGGLSLVLLATTLLTGHSAAKPDPLGLAAAGLHLLAVSAWAGGLVMLVIGVLGLREALPPSDWRKAAAGVVSRFSALAAAAVGLAIVSGVVLSGQLVASWAGLLLTPYGQTLLVKLLVAAAALGLGVYNALTVQGRAELAGRQVAAIAAEAALAAGLVFAAAMLADLPPAASVAAGPPDDQNSLALPGRAGGLMLTGSLAPARAGTNVFSWEAVTAAGESASGLQIELEFHPVGGGALASTLALAEPAAGRYTGTANPFQRAGDWQMLVTVRQPGGETDYARFDLAIGPDGVVRLAETPLPGPVRAVGWLNQHGRTLLAGLGLSLAAGWSWTAWRAWPALRLSPAWWLAAGLLLAAMLWLLIALRA